MKMDGFKVDEDTLREVRRNVWVDAVDPKALALIDRMLVSYRQEAKHYRREIAGFAALSIAVAYGLPLALNQFLALELSPVWPLVSTIFAIAMTAMPAVMMRPDKPDQAEIDAVREIRHRIGLDDNVVPIGIYQQ